MSICCIILDPPFDFGKPLLLRSVGFLGEVRKLGWSVFDHVGFFLYLSMAL